MIKGIYADEADKLHSNQWVNVYHSSCQVKDLNLYDPEDYGLELPDEDGNVGSKRKRLE